MSGIIGSIYDPYEKYNAASITNKYSSNNSVNGTKVEAGASGANEINGIQECETCSSRAYQDGSNDPGVSFKTPTKLDPAAAATAVYSHEREHYTREEAKAEEEGREVLSNNIVLFTDVCTECGKTYVSGGETTTVSRKKAEQASFAKDFFDKNIGVFLPKIMDVRA